MNDLNFEAYDFLESSQRKKLLEKREILAEKRGTKEAIELVCELLTGQSVKMTSKPFQLDILFEEHLEDAIVRKLYRVLDDVTPVWMQVHIVDLTRQCSLDAYSMLDDNAVLVADERVMDGDVKMDMAALK